MDLNGHYRITFNLVYTRVSGYYDIPQRPLMSTTSQAIGWGKSGVKL